MGGNMKAESLALVMDEAGRLESKLLALVDKLHGYIERSTYEEIEEQVRNIAEAIRSLKKLLLRLKVTIQ